MRPIFDAMIFAAAFACAMFGRRDAGGREDAPNGGGFLPQSSGIISG